MARKHKIPTDLKRSEVLGLDIAQHCGFYSKCGGGGTWNFLESKSRNNNKEHGAFRETLIDFIKENNIRVICAEDVNVKGYFAAMRKLSEFRGILLEVCDALDMPEPEFMNVKSIKLFATGNGSATKDQMIKACVEKWNYTPGDDNEADAFHVFNYFCRKFKIK